MTAPRITWIRAGDRYPDLKHDLDNFIALDPSGAEIGVVRWIENSPGDTGWLWSMILVHAGKAFPLVTSGNCATRGQAAKQLGACYQALGSFIGPTIRSTA